MSDAVRHACERALERIGVHNWAKEILMEVMDDRIAFDQWEKKKHDSDIYAFINSNIWRVYYDLHKICMNNLALIPSLEEAVWLEEQVAKLPDGGMVLEIARRWTFYDLYKRDRETTNL